MMATESGIIGRETRTSSCSGGSKEETSNVLKDDTLDRVRLVFGDSVVVDENGENDSFFMYTPSPSRPELSQGSKQGEREQSQSSLKKSNSGGNTVSSHSSKSVSHEMADKENSVSLNMPTKTTVQVKAPSPALGYNQRSEMNRKSRFSSELIKKTQEAIEKATMSLQDSVGVAPKKKKDRKPLGDVGVSKDDGGWDRELSEAKDFYQKMQQKRAESLRVQRQLSSQLSRNKASFREMMQNTKLQRIDEEAQFKSSVYREHTDNIREERERRRRDSEDARAKLRANARIGLEKLEKEKREEEQAIHDERYAASQAIRQARKEAAEQRRKSFQFRSGDARRIREIRAKMRAEETENTHKSYELEREAAKDVQEYRKQEARERRESLANRGKHARQVKKTEMQRMTECKTKEHESSELERAAAKDVADVMRQEEKRRQKYLAELNAEARQIRQQLAKQEAEQMEASHKSYELKRVGEKDVEEYKKTSSQKRRESLAFRGKEAVRQLQEASQKISKQLEEEHQSYELKWNAEKDVECYYKKQRDERRASLANRNKEHSRHVKVMQEIETLAREKETESFFLKWAGENDVKEYEKKLQRERKESLENRGKEKARIRKLEAEERAKQIEQMHEDELLRSNDQKAIEEYRRKCAERDRMSLEYRGKEFRKQKLQEEEARRVERKSEEENFELETKARKDVEDYVAVCKQRRRYSLAFRAKEKRSHIHWKEQQEKEARLEQSNIIQGRLMDHRYMEMAEQQEKAARAMDALQSQLRLYNKKAKNPFRDLLD